MSVAGSVWRWVRACGAGLVDLVLPDVCPTCDARDVTADGLCTACNLALLDLVAKAYCPRCGTSLGPGVPARPDGCAACPTPLPRFERIVRLGDYRGPLREMVHLLKFRRCEVLLPRTAGLLAEAVQAALPGLSPDVIVPVPMHWRRRLLRGTDHAGALARALSRSLHVPVAEELIRTRDTTPQVHLPRTRRVENVRGAFAPAGGVDVVDRTVLLVDDVSTTGATLNEAARVLLEVCAGRVIAVVMAKTPPPVAYAQRS